MDRLAEQRATACIAALVARGVAQERLYVTFQGRAGGVRTDFIPRSVADNATRAEGASARLAAVAAELGGVQFHLAGEIGLPTATTFWSVEHLDPAVRAKNQQVVRAVAAVMKSHPELRLEINCQTAAHLELPPANEGDALRAPEALCARFNVHALEVRERPMQPHAHVSGALPLYPRARSPQPSRSPACDPTLSSLHAHALPPCDPRLVPPACHPRLAIPACHLPPLSCRLAPPARHQVDAVADRLAQLRVEALMKALMDEGLPEPQLLGTFDGGPHVAEARASLTRTRTRTRTRTLILTRARARARARARTRTRCAPPSARAPPRGATRSRPPPRWPRCRRRPAAPPPRRTYGLRRSGCALTLTLTLTLTLNLSLSLSPSLSVSLRGPRRSGCARCWRMARSRGTCRPRRRRARARSSRRGR